MAVQAQPADATAGPATTTGAVTTAFALGWQMARLYGGQLSSNAEPKLDEDLPGLSRLPAGLLASLGLAQADDGLGRIVESLGAGATLPTTEAARTELSKDPPERDAIRKAILDLHIRLLIDLTAADYKLGKAYGLGRALADTCASAHGDAERRKRVLEHHLEQHRALVLVGWLDDLKTVLPPHAGQAVLDSLQRWTRWAEAIELGALDEKAVNDTTRALHRCGQRWRAILSGEKNAKDLLETEDYVSAVRGLLARAGAIGRSLAWRMKVPFAGAAILIGVGLALIVLNHSTAQVLAGLGTVAGGLGITWRSTASSLGRVSLGLAKPLWEAELDIVIGNQLTPSPQRSYSSELQRSRGRLRRAWRELKRPDVETTPRGAPASANESED